MSTHFRGRIGKAIATFLALLVLCGLAQTGPGVSAGIHSDNALASTVTNTPDFAYLPAVSNNSTATSTSTPTRTATQTRTPTASPTSTPNILGRVFGMNFSPYKDGQSPLFHTPITEQQIRERMQIIAPYTKWIRTFGCGEGLEFAGRVAHLMGLKIAMGAYIGADDGVNQSQVSCLINQVKSGNADVAVVGNEALLNGATLTQLRNAIQQVQQAIPAAIPVTTAEIYSNYLDHPELVQDVDLMFVNIYPYWEGYHVNDAIGMIHKRYVQLAALGKLVVISEAGWPSCDNPNELIDQAVGNPTNAAQHFKQFTSWAKDHNVLFFYFEAFDEQWKTLGEGTRGGCWGVWSSTGVMKSGMKPVFDNVHTAYSQAEPHTCNTNTVSIAFTTVPPKGTFGDLFGLACGFFNQDKRVVVFIKVNNVWWIKPYANAPKTFVPPSGNWVTDITTGGIDEQATTIRAYLIPTDVDPFGDLSGYPFVEVNR